MKKTIIAACIIVASAAYAFADGFWIGPTALYNVPVVSSGVSTPEDFDGNFWYGLDARLELGILKGEATVLHIPPVVQGADKGSLLTLLDVGLGIDLLFLNAGIGVGPNFLFFLSDEVSEPMKFGVNLKASAGIKLGKIGLNVYTLYIAEDFAALAATDFENSSFLVGMNIQFKL